MNVSKCKIQPSECNKAMAKNVMDTLRERGFIKQTVFEEDLYELLGKESVPFTSDLIRRRTVSMWATSCS